MSEQITKEIDRLVTKYPRPDSQELFRAELEYLASIANKEGYIECMKTTQKVLSNPNVV